MVHKVTPVDDPVLKSEAICGKGCTSVTLNDSPTRNERLVNTTNERRLVQGHETQLRVKEDIEDVSSELDNRG
ncbi:hypothetical protein TNCV_17241 [Trichonephila clavipes]|nr:hypothetical protein TNCV_17241 [Trichonephila clavipes]